jgi:hypothetical protein
MSFMLYELQNNTPAPATGIYTDATGIRHDTNALAAAWSDAELQAIGLYKAQRIEPQLVPGQTILRWELSFTGEAVLETAVLSNPPTPEELRAEVELIRQSAFQSEADPLFFKWHAGEGTEQEWLAKREEIRSRYPYPED